MAVKRIDHVAIAVKNLEATAKTFEQLFGVKPAHTETWPDQGVKACLIKIGDTEIELIEPIDPEGGVAKFIERKGEGLHHISLEVDNVDADLKSLAARQIPLVDKQGRRGLAGRVGFLHPKATDGVVLIELAQKV